MQLLLETGPLGYAQLALTVGGLLWALVCAVLYGLRWKVPAVVAVAPLGAHALLIIVGTLWSASRVNEAVLMADPSMRATMMAAGIAETLGHGQLAIAAVPAAALLLLAGLFSGVRGTRAYGAPAVAFLCATLAAGLAAASLTAHAEVPLALARALIYAMAAIPLAAALAGRHAQDSSREGGLVAAVSFATLVAACESMGLARGWSMGFRAIAMADPAAKKTIVESFAGEMSSIAVFSWAAMAFALAPVVVALLRPSADLTEEEVMSGNISPSGARWLGNVLALGVPLLWAAAVLTADPSGSFAVILK
jgi:hypothetical protein